MVTTTTKFYIHILEIKKRTVYITLSLFSAFAFCYSKWLQLSYIFLLSFPNKKELQKNFIFTDVSEAFSSTLWVCFLFSFLFVLPFVVYQFICFCIPSWYQHERRTRCFFFLVSFLSWYCSIYLGHQFLIPYLCAFLLEFEVSTNCLQIAVQPKIYAYISWASSIMIYITFLFLCLSIFLYSYKKRWLNISEWQKQRPFCFFLSLLLAAFLSPPEIWSELFLAFAFSLTLELYIWFYFILFQMRCNAKATPKS